jgi:phosphate uptake regulator
MKRKIIRMADSTSLISLPKKWIDLNSINKGEEIEIQEIGNNLMIRGKQSLISTAIDLKNIIDKDLIWRYIVTAYRKGIDTISVEYNKEETLKEVQKFIGDLIGYAIVKQEDNNLIIKDLIQADNNHLDETLKKVLSLLIEVANTSYKSINKCDKDSLKTIDHADYNINRFTNLFLRILNRQGHLKFENTSSYYNTISLIEEIGDEYRRLADIYDGKKVSPEIMVFFKSVNYLLQDYEELFYNFDLNKFKNFHDVSNRIMRLLINLNEKNLNEARIIGSLSTIFHLTKSLGEESIIINL